MSQAVAFVRVILSVVVAGSVLFAAALVIVRLVEPRLAFFPIPGEGETPVTHGLPFQSARLSTTDGERIAAWLLPHDRPRAFILYFHGNGGNLSLWLPVLSGLHRQGYAVAAIDYRGYGRSTGAPSEQGLYRDVDSALAWIDRLERPTAPLIFWGRSLGTTLAAYAATRHRPDGLVLESGFPNARALVRTTFPLNLLSGLSSYRFPTDRFAAQAASPILVMHGDADSVIPFEQGSTLFASLPEPKHFLRISGSDHNDLVRPPSYWEAVRAFIDGCAAGASAPRPQHQRPLP